MLAGRHKRGFGKRLPGMPGHRQNTVKKPGNPTHTGNRIANYRTWKKRGGVAIRGGRNRLSWKKVKVRVFLS
jgi:hypothetical protein